MPQKSKNESTAFKNWISKNLVAKMAAHLKFHQKDFDDQSFAKVAKQLAPLELKPRVRLIRDSLKSHLNNSYLVNLELLLKAALEPPQGLEPLRGFDLWPFAEFIQTHGLEHPRQSLAALELLTPVFTAEFAVRPFLIQDSPSTLRLFKKWARSRNHHVRRLASEGSRPRLPWGEQIKAFIQDPGPTVEILNLLKYDDELYVRKSVANHLNDISKDHPELALQIATSWLKTAPEKYQEKIQWIVRHALRSEIKKGNKQALKLIGFESKGKIHLKDLRCDSLVNIGDGLNFEFEILCNQDTPVMIDYVIHYQKANGQLSKKVFKLTSKNLLKKKNIKIQKRHPFKVITTRVFYPGAHKISIMVNGEVLGESNFVLKKKRNP